MDPETEPDPNLLVDGVSGVVELKLVELKLEVESALEAVSDDDEPCEMVEVAE